MEKLLWKEKLSYGIGAYGKDFIYNMIAAFLMIFYTDVVGVSLIFVSTLFLVRLILYYSWCRINNFTSILWIYESYLNILI